MGRPVVHWEFWSEKPQRLAGFYEDLFGWHTQDVPQLDCHMVAADGQGGIDDGTMKPEAGPWRATPALYADFDNLDLYKPKLEGAGGKTLVESVDIPGVGKLSIFEDPDGRVLGMWQRQDG
jgi:predicted enzyme related to lactoylglutathione lyase